jgi:glycosyltransferase involved in cell wall biosynthesis
MMKKTIKKILKTMALVVDYITFVFLFLLCLVALLSAIPWIFKQRRIWQNSAKGNHKALFIQPFSLERVKKQGYELILPFRNPSMKWIGLLDPANSQDANIRFADNFELIAWKSPKIVEFLEKLKFFATSIIFRELITVLKITCFCNKERIGILRAYKHNYPALRAYLVSSFIKIPYIVDISGNYELKRRLIGKQWYFRKLNRLPIIKIFSTTLTNWLLGLPLRHAFHVFGRNKFCHEHAFALGTPIDRLSVLRINAFNAAFNSYNPEKPPAKPADYPYILFVGRLSELKFPLDVLDAFNLAAPHLPEYRLVIIGDGAIRHDVEQRKERSEYRDRIVLLGACSSDIVLTWTAHATVSLCPLSGSVLAEAMLCGIPVIAYDVAGHSEIVIDDYTGFLVPFRDTAALAEKLIYVIRNYEESRIIARQGRDLARAVFDKEKIWQKESLHYMQALTDS